MEGSLLSQTTMHDPLGIGEALRMSMRMYSHSARATGRTETLVAGLRNGDTVVTTMRMEGTRIRGLAKKRGVHVQVIIDEPREGTNVLYRKLCELNCRPGTVYMDHLWYEAFYYYSIERAMLDLGALDYALQIKDGETP